MTQNLYRRRKSIVFLVLLYTFAQLMLTIGLVVRATCFARSDPSPTVPDTTQEVGPPTYERVSPERPVQRERLAERDLPAKSGPG
ncbi:MAG: hypothetical protein ABIU05_10445 [Nitrospirales bacterium]